MIQRIQTLYLAISILFLLSLLSGIALLTFTNVDKSLNFNVFGLFYKAESKQLVDNALVFPFYLIDIFLVLIHTLTLIKFKNLRSQLKLAQYGFLFYVIFGLALLVFALTGNNLVLNESTVTPRIGLFTFLAGIPFSFLAVKSIKKDKALVDSVDRIR